MALFISGCGTQTKGDIASSEPSAGQRLFWSKCRRCHKLDGIGGKKGKDLSTIDSTLDANYFEKLLLDPKNVRENPKMPKPKLTDEERAALIEFLESRRAADKSD
jgi:cytochrome c2